jgi:hypothetical protein
MARRAALAAVLALATPAHADDFVFTVTAPDFKVTLPAIPPMKLDVHPMHAAHPQLRYLGSDGAYTVSVMTPTAQKGMNSLECASATLGTIVKRGGAPAREEMYRAKLNERTYVAIYATPLPTALQLSAHLMSAAGGTHCVEVHVTKVSTSQEDIDTWVKGFDKADIQAN